MKENNTNNIIIFSIMYAVYTGNFCFHRNFSHVYMRIAGDFFYLNIDFYSTVAKVKKIGTVRLFCLKQFYD